MHESILLQVGVKVFLKNREEKFLLLKRSRTRYPSIKNFWDIPGGRIFPGSSLLKNIKREVFEETKLPLLAEPRIVFAQDIIRVPEKHIVRLTFVSFTEGTPVLDEEHTDFKWLALDEMRNMKKLDEFTREVLEKRFHEICSL